MAHEPSKHEQVHIAVQAICPVSGEKLGEHGEPIKVKIGEENIFLCCKQCMQGQVKPQYWGAIHANFAKAQRICPVMKKDLPANPKWTVVSGQIFYICCPPCSKKIAADPQSYLKQIDELYTASFHAQENRQ